jgi:hypothetical protein
VEISKLTFEQWLEIGLKAGYTSPPVCMLHDGLPTTITEDAEMLDGSDPCIYLMRLYESSEHKEAVEANVPATKWRNPYREYED